MSRAVASALAHEYRAPDEQVFQEQLHLMIEQSRRATHAVPVVAVLLGLMLQPAAGWALYLGWLAALLVIVALRDRLLRYITERSPPAHMAARAVLISAAAIGFVASASAPLFFPYLSDSERGVVTALLCGWVSLASTLIGAYPKAYRVYLVIFLANLIFAWLLYGERNEALALSGSLVLAGVLLWRFSDQVAELIEEAVNIRFAQQMLVERLRKALGEAQTANAARTRFLAAASHDLRQPVHALMLLASLLDKPASEQRRAEIAQKIGATAESLESMFRGLLDLARMDAGAVIMRSGDVSLRRLCESLAASYEERCTRVGIRLELDCPEGLVVHADASLLARMLSNILDNAVKFTSRGSITLSCAARTDKEVIIEVRDTGVGIAPEDIAHVCEAFYRGKSASQLGAEGIGLGLAISSQMAALMGLGFDIQSASGQGTSVRLVAPRTQTEEPAAPAPAKKPLRCTVVALIEDDGAARDATTMWFEERGCTVVAGEDAETVIRSFDDLGMQPDFIISDFHIGGELNGKEAISRLRARFGPVRAAIITGDTAPSLAAEAGVPVLIKPVKPEALEALLGT